MQVRLAIYSFIPESTNEYRCRSRALLLVNSMEIVNVYLIFRRVELELNGDSQDSSAAMVQRLKIGLLFSITKHG